MKDEIAEDFESLSVTISSIYDLRGIGVSAAYVSKELWNWMVEQSKLVPFHEGGDADQRYSEVGVEFHKTKTRALKATMQPYGADRIPVKVKYTGKNPWKLVCGYRKETRND